MIMIGGSGLLLGAIMTWMFLHSRKVVRAGFRGQIAFLFDGATLVDSTRPAADLLKDRNPRQTELDAIVALLAHRFPGLEDAILALDELGDTSIPARDGEEGLLLAERVEGMTRIVLEGGPDSTARDLSSDMMLQSLQAEVEMLRRVSDGSPLLMWQTDSSGTITWANESYMDFVENHENAPYAVWPPRNLFEKMGENDNGRQRHAILPKYGSEPMWFEVSTNRTANGLLHSAVDISEQVRAEDLQRDLQQTLTKTFAGLQIGLAVFDRNRQLVLFNPALAKLTTLNPVDLVARPQIHSFLDMLREKRTVPEPRDYASWREQLTAMETAAEAGDFVENWTLYDGRTYRVTGRPFPNGAIALFLEDVSNDVALNVKVKMASQLAQDTLDTIPEGLLVVRATGEVALANRAMAEVLGLDLGTEAEAPALDLIDKAFASSSDWKAALQAIRNGKTPDEEVFVASAKGAMYQVTASSAGKRTAVFRLVPREAHSTDQTVVGLTA